MLCSAMGNADPEITWLKDFIPVDLTDPRLKLLATGKWKSSNTQLTNTLQIPTGVCRERYCLMLEQESNAIYKQDLE